MIMEIQKGRVYRAKKKPKNTRGYFDDRHVLYVGDRTVQYDSPSVGMNSPYPSVSLEKFKAWVGEDVTENLPDDEWQQWGLTDG